MTAAVADLLTLPSDTRLSTDAECAAPSRDSAEVRVLLKEAREGSAEAFGRLVALHERVVFRAAMAALGSHADAEDAAQDAFVVAWQKLGGFRGEAQFRTWLLTIVWRKALDRRRRRALWWKRAASPPEREPASDPLEDLPAETPGPEARAVATDEARRVRAEIRRLSPRLRDTLLLAASGEHTYDEIAGMLGIPLGTVKWRVAEARRLLTARCGGRHA